MIIRPATHADFTALYGKEPPMSMRAWVAEKDGAPVALAGYCVNDGLAFAFTDFGEKLTKRELITGARFFMEKLRALKVTVIAKEGCSGVTVLKHFGFERWGSFWRYEHG